MAKIDEVLAKVEQIDERLNQMVSPLSLLVKYAHRVSGETCGFYTKYGDIDIADENAPEFDFNGLYDALVLRNIIFEWARLKFEKEGYNYIDNRGFGTIVIPPGLAAELSVQGKLMIEDLGSIKNGPDEPLFNDRIPRYENPPPPPPKH